jgi:putative restriction endonuclease
VKLFVGVTDFGWFSHLKEITPEEVNFWQPYSSRHFKAVQPGALILFKLHAPRNAIAGGGIFVKEAMMPASVTWDAFRETTGQVGRRSFENAIYHQRGTDKQSEPDPIIRSLVLSHPFFLDEVDWIPTPDDWAMNIGQGKTYEAEGSEGQSLLEALKNRIDKKYWGLYELDQQSETELGDYKSPNAFKIAVSEAYHGRCAMTDEATRPALEATYIKPLSEGGASEVSNGILLRKDLLGLFESGYIGIGDHYNILVSKKAASEGVLSETYLKLDGKTVRNLPDRFLDRPLFDVLEWHREKVFIG